MAVLWATPTLAAPAPLRVTHARLDRDGPQTDNRGRVLIKTVIDTSASGIDLFNALLTNAVVVTVRDAGQFNLNVLLTHCVQAGSRIRCRNGTVRAELKRTGALPVYRFQLIVHQLSSAITGAAPPRGRVQVTLGLRGSADHVDVISDCAPLGQSSLACRDQDRPNVIFIVTDDQRWDTVQYMPRTLDQIANRGVTFSNAFTTTPSCAASRASMLSGLYARHHGVHTVAAPDGGASKFVGPDQSTLATWLHDAGYRTGMYGKYITDYAKQCPPATSSCYIPPGWDEWHVLVQQHYYNYRLAENDRINTFGATEADYVTDVLGAQAVDFIMNAQGQPFFLHVGFIAPHQEGAVQPIPAPRHFDSQVGLPLWRPPAYDEADMSDKPPWYALLPRASMQRVGLLTHGSWGDLIRQRQIESLAAVDEAVEAMMAALDATGQTDNTIVVFTSDNGHLWGEHRYFFGKGPAQEESIRIPLAMRFPRRIQPGGTDARLALNIDLPPTLARLAGVEPPSTLDGVDLSPLFADASSAGREDFVVEAWLSADTQSTPTYAGIRTDRWKYVPYPIADRAELYDLVNDPYELDNRADDPAHQPTVAMLQTRLDALIGAPSRELQRSNSTVP